MSPIDLERLLTVDALRVEALRLGDAEPGVDLIRPADLARSPWRLARMRRDVLAGTWRPQLVKQRGVWKKGGGMRMLSILAAEDRVLQGALHRLVAPVLDARLDDRVHGWRKGRGCASAVWHLQAQAGEAAELVVVQADIAALFDTLPHAGIEQAVVPLGCAAWGLLHRAWLRAWPTAAGRGVPQGAPLSPLLANLVLGETFDRVIDLARLQGRIRGWVRYGDDLLVVAAGPAAETAGRAALDQAAAASSLRIHPGKTRVYRGEGTWPVLGQLLRIERSGERAAQLRVGPAPRPPGRSARPAPPRSTPAEAPPSTSAARAWLTRLPWPRILGKVR